MASYNLYAGLITGFNHPVDYKGTWEFNSAAEARAAARELAIEIYQSYEGCCRYDLMSWKDCKKQLETEGYKPSTEDINKYYAKEIDRWIDYYAVLASYDPKNSY